MGHLCRYVCLPPPYPTPQASTTAAKLWSPDFYHQPPKSCRLRWFHIDGSLNVSFPDLRIASDVACRLAQIDLQSIHLVPFGPPS